MLRSMVVEAATRRVCDVGRNPSPCLVAVTGTCSSQHQQQQQQTWLHIVRFEVSVGIASSRHCCSWALPKGCMHAIVLSPLAWKKKKKIICSYTRSTCAPSTLNNFFLLLSNRRQELCREDNIREKKERVQNRIGPKETTLNNFNFRYLRNWKWTAVCLLDREMFQTLFNLLAAARIVYWIWMSKCVCTTGYWSLHCTDNQLAEL